MKAEEKKILYNLIKTSSQYINGYTHEFFKGEEPVFTGNGTLEGPFSVTVQDAGVYTISCAGSRVEGSIEFVIK